MDDSEQVEFTATATASDVIWGSVAVARSSVFAVAFGTFMLVTSIAMIATSGEIWPAVAMSMFGLALITGLFAAPFAWLSVYQNRDTQLAPTDVRADAEEISFRSPGSSSTSEWTAYRRAGETPHAFLLEQRTGPVIILPKRGVDPASLTRFRTVLADRGLLDIVSRQRRILRTLRSFAIGLAATVGVIAATTVFVLLQANARIDIEVTAADGIATVRGSTDLPDGSLVLVEVYQADEWRRGMGNGQPPDIETFPWIRGHDVTVDDGRFHATIAIGGWPSGSGGAIAQFWVDPAQPDTVRDRFGEHGESLRGPQVDAFDDGTPRLRVNASFEIP